jgi:protein-disulfide isomerase
MTAQTPRGRSSEPSTAIATIGTISVSEDSFRALVGNRLLALESQVYRVKRQLLDRVIAERLFELAAREARQSPSEYTKRELSKRIKPVTDEEVRAIYDGSKEHLATGAETDAMGNIRRSLEQSRAAQARQRLVQDLRERYPVRVQLAPPRIEVPKSDAPAKGPANAPVRVVVFSDFQCPFCAQLASTLVTAQSRLGDQIRLEYRHFPLPMHKEAGMAAEAASCMSDQGRFWEMHDTLYGNQKRLAREDLLGYAETARGDPKLLRECLDSGRMASRVAEDKRAGEELGVAATPATFINGRLVAGAVPLQELLDIVEEELQSTPSGVRRASATNR